MIDNPNKVAPWPTDDKDVTADALARYFTAWAAKANEATMPWNLRGKTPMEQG